MRRSNQVRVFLPTNRKDSIMGRQHGVKRESILDGVMTVCKCPKCDGLHYVYMNWTGRGMPRVYCTVCKYNIETGGWAGVNDNYGAVNHRKPKSRVTIPHGPLFENDPISQRPIIPI